MAFKRSVMTLYSDAQDVYSHQVRIALAEKGVTVDILSVDATEPPQDLVDLNPYCSLPTLVDRDLVLYNTRIILEYLDERFPHPPLLPVYPVARAKSRLMIHRIEEDWYSLYRTATQEKDKSKAQKACQMLKESLMSLGPIFSDMPYFLSEDFTLVDCTIAPLLWRLPKLGIALPPSAKSVIQYAERLFERDAFKASLTEAEHEMRETDDEVA